jgi:hypothetical protein
MGYESVSYYRSVRTERLYIIGPYGAFLGIDLTAIPLGRIDPSAMIYSTFCYINTSFQRKTRIGDRRSLRLIRHVCLNVNIL